jgi:hypothetical protein
MTHSCSTEPEFVRLTVISWFAATDQLVGVDVPQVGARHPWDERRVGEPVVEITRLREEVERVGTVGHTRPDERLDEIGVPGGLDRCDRILLGVRVEVADDDVVGAAR